MTSGSRLAIDPSKGGERVPTTAARAQTSILRLRIQPLGDSLPDFHGFVHTLLARSVRPATAQRVAACAAELLDNALAYGTVSNDVVLEIRLDALSVSVEVSNDTVRSRARMLQARVEELREQPETAYLEAMRLSTKFQGARSMMGLARVRHEGRMELTVEVEGDSVTVVATGAR